MYGQDRMLFLVRGLPGSGKSTLALQLAATVSIGVVHAADDYFVTVDGVYNFDPAKLGDAHRYCQHATRAALQQPGIMRVCVANTFTRRWELEPYFDIAREVGCGVAVISLFNGGKTDEELARRNTHGVPIAAIEAMRSRFEHDIGTYPF